jgi:thiol-disulfide isomerase/thioredoxin
VNRRIAWLLAIVALAIALLVLRPLFTTTSSAQGPSGLQGQAAPVFSLRDDNGTPVSLTDYRGKIVVMNLWASWCPPCRAEMPDLQRLSDTYASRGIAIVGVNEGESSQRARAFAASLGLPTTVIVGRDGRVVHGFDGQLTYAQMRTAVSGLVVPR